MVSGILKPLIEETFRRGAGTFAGAMQKTQVQSLGWEDPLGGGHGSPLQYSCLEDSMDSGAW